MSKKYQVTITSTQEEVVEIDLNKNELDHLISIERTAGVEI